MILDHLETNEACVIRVGQPRIDAACAIDFKEAMRNLTATTSRRIILDLQEVTFIDSSGLGAVVAVKKMLGGEQVLELARLSPAVEKVFRLTRMDSVFAIHAQLPDSAADAP